jgi:hypothetical protein
MSYTATWVALLHGFVESQVKASVWFIASAFIGLDAGTVDILNEPFDALAALSAGVAGWALEVFHGLGLAGLLARAFGRYLASSTNWFWFSWFWRWQWFACRAALAFNHYCLLLVWIADLAGLWLINKFVVQADVFCA